MFKSTRCLNSFESLQKSIVFWRLSALACSPVCSNHRRYNSTKTSDPLKILFCGSDEFSIASLHALNNAKRDEHGLIESIDVLHRPGKRTGRGLKVTREVPIKSVAQNELRLNTHAIDTFTGWKPPESINLIVVVSFGLFVPPRILKGAKYGGLNVHPSLLPDLSGPAPMYHTLLKERNRTGLTIQTLHPKHFDKGTILAQTPAPGLHVPAEATVAELVAYLGRKGGEMLVDLLKTRKFVPPLEDAGWYSESSGPVHHAEKIDKKHSYVDCLTDTAKDILVRHRVLGDLWFTLSNLPEGERVILHEIERFIMSDSDTPREPGLFVPRGSTTVAIKTVDKTLLQIKRCTISGGRKGQGTAQLKLLLERF